MRIKFEKGMTPERIAETFVDYIRSNDLAIGSVNMYIQTYGEDMKAEKHSKEGYLVCSPGEYSKLEYVEDMAEIRRGRMRVI